ncbi:MAG: prolyl oligopeptidase family serine peptidase [Planctomycetes bacterium]|nr:prolyl oligopeptidase family serine peptidase [Planctomycetota bacterium]
MIRAWSLLPVLTGFFALPTVPAPAEDPPGDKVFHDYLAARAAEIEARFLPEVRSPADFERLKPRLREEYLHMLGLWPLPERTPLEASVTGTLDRGDHVVEKLHFQSRPRLYVTGNLYRPKETGGRRLPAILYLCGHSGAGRNGNKVQFQEHGIWFAKHGYVCLAIDTLQLGEIAAIHHGTYREGRWWWLSAGYTPAGVECWNGVRAIDYLVSRPDVDPERIGVTGISGGGAATFWVAAADDRVRAAAPVSGMADLESYVADRVVNGHCDCMFLHNTFRWSWTNIAALVCPRPLLFANSDQDSIFPMDANERVIARLERLYAVLGQGDKVDAVVSIGGHAYREDLRRAVFEFFDRELRGVAAPVLDSGVGLAAGEPPRPQIPFEELRAFPRDQDLPRDQLNTRIDEVFVPRGRPGLPEAGRVDAWRGELLGELSRACFGAWPRDAADPHASYDASSGQGVAVTQPGITIYWRVPSRPEDLRRDLWVVVLGPGDSREELPRWAAGAVGDSPAVLLPTRGAGHPHLEWTRKSPPNTVERSLVLVGETADGGRVLDVARTLRGLKALGARRLRLAGRGDAGVIAAYAVLYASEAEEVVAFEPPASHAPSRGVTAGGPAILNVLRVLDIPEAFGLLAPRRLTLRGTDPADFRGTAEIYERAGARDALELR